MSEIVLKKADGSTETFSGVNVIRTKDTSGEFANKFYVPEGTLPISENGTVDVAEYASVTVDVHDIIDVEELPTSNIDLAKYYRMGDAFYKVKGGSNSAAGVCWDKYYIPTFQTKTTTANGSVTPDDGYDGLSSVTVAVPLPSGSVDITANGDADVTDYVTAKVKVPAVAALEDGTEVSGGIAWSNIYMNAWADGDTVNTALSGLSKVSIAGASGYIVAAYQNTLGDYAVVYITGSDGAYRLNVLYTSSTLSETYGSQSIDIPGGSFECNGDDAVSASGLAYALSISKSFYKPVDTVASHAVGESNSDIKNIISATPFLYSAKETLETPYPYVNGNILTVANTDNTAKYYVYIDGTKKAEVTYADMLSGYDLSQAGVTTSGSHTVQVQAVPDRSYYQTSGLSSGATWGQFAVSYSLTGCTASAAPTTIDASTTQSSPFVLALAITEGYLLEEDDITVTNASYSATIGDGSIALSLWAPTGAVTVTAAGTLQTFDITYDLTGCTTEYASWTVNYGDSYEVQLDLQHGYKFVSNPTISGTCDSSWNKDTGVLTLTNIKSDIKVTITALYSLMTITYTLDGCTVDDTEKTIWLAGSKTITVTPSTGRALGSESAIVPTVTGATKKSWTVNSDGTGTLVIEKATANVSINIGAGYSFDLNLTHVHEDPILSHYLVTPTTSRTLYLNADSGYELPDSVTASGVTVTSWNPDSLSAEGTLVIGSLNAATTTRSITVEGIRYYNITVNGTGITAGDTNTNRIYEDDTVYLYYYAQDGYELPESLSISDVSGATAGWAIETDTTLNVPRGKLTLRNPTDDVTVTITATKINKTTINIVATNCVASTSQVVVQNNASTIVTFTTSGNYWFNSNSLRFVASPQTPALTYNVMWKSSTEVQVGFTGSETSAGTVYTFGMAADEMPKLATPTNLTIEVEETYPTLTADITSLSLTIDCDKGSKVELSGGTGSYEIQSITGRDSIPEENLAISIKNNSQLVFDCYQSSLTGTYTVVTTVASGSQTLDVTLTVTYESNIVTYTDCLTFTGESGDFTLKANSSEWDGTVYYSVDHSTWTVWDGSAVSSANSKLYLRGKGNTKFYTSDGTRLKLSAKAACSGNIQTLLEYDNPPAKISASYCYYSLFSDCSGLTTAPELPATTLTDYCYSYMFHGCTGLTTAPELPATTLASRCYYYMFYGCTGIKLSTTQTGNYTRAYRIPKSGTGTTASNAMKNMFTSTGGTFTGTPSINTTYYMYVSG